MRGSCKKNCLGDFEGNLQEFKKDFERNVVRIGKASGLWKEIGKLLYFAGIRKDCGRILKGC